VAVVRAIAAFCSGSCSRIVDQNLAHYAGRNSQEMNSSRELPRLVSAELQIRLVDERGGLQSVLRSLAAEVPGRQCGAVRYRAL
jgi:hypothetical protein